VYTGCYESVLCMIVKETVVDYTI